jgi:peptidoglycan/LPS O-acetylase OafA/YrhL
VPDPGGDVVGADRAPEARVHFKGLNGIRALTALAILVFHVNLSMGLFGLEKREYGSLGMAGFRVSVFFVMSGFLTTYLLLAEKARLGRVDLGKFYARRILRIWPVYYLAILLAAALTFAGVADAPGRAPLAVGLYSFMLPNVAYAIGLKWWVVAQLWSVGALEQFFAFWPVLLGRASRVGRSLVMFIAGYALIKVGLRVLEHGPVYDLVRITGFDSMAMGGVAAVVLLRGGALLRWAYRPAVQVGCWSFVAWGVLVEPVHLASVIDAEIHSVVISILVLNVSSNPRTLVSLEHPVLDRLGRISYGIYAYHMAVVFLLAHALKGHLTWTGSRTGAHLFVQGASLAGTVLMALGSHAWIETRFLALKGRFVQVPASN